jgi:ribonuclease J
VVSLNVLDGAGVIGGTKILVESPHARVLLDFGTNFSRWNSYFEEYLKPRSSRGLLDAARLGLLPPFPHLYRTDFLPPSIDPWDGIEIPEFAKRPIDAILMTNCHLDHCGCLSYVRGDIPILATISTAFLMKAIQESGKGDFEKEINYCVPREEKNGVLKSTHYQKGPSRQRPFLTTEQVQLSAEAAAFWSNTIVSRALIPTALRQVNQIGDLAFRSFPVDHSVPGCAAFVLETESGPIVYTGDLRLHGANGELTRQFAEAVARTNPKILICEGTRVSRMGDAIVTEADVHQSVQEVVRGAGGLVIADFGSRNLERLQTFRDIASECGRSLVLMTKDIHLLRANYLATGEGRDPVTDPILLLYEEEKAADSSADRTIYATYPGKLTNAQSISKDVSKYIICFSYWDINELILIHPGPGSVYIYSSSEAYDEEQCADMRRLHNWLKFLGVQPYGVPDPDTGKPTPGETRFHASGHASAEDLLSLIDTINPKTLIPVHTEYPEFFLENCARDRTVLIPQMFQNIPV